MEAAMNIIQEADPENKHLFEAGTDSAKRIAIIRLLNEENQKLKVATHLEQRQAAQGETVSLVPDVDQQFDHPALSRCQLQVLRLLGDGKSNREIAEALCRSPNTVKLHVSAILHRLNLKSRTQAALIASEVEW
jgi:DNA-binding NarL/FixJ family response regulator